MFRRDLLKLLTALPVGAAFASSTSPGRPEQGRHAFQATPDYCQTLLNELESRYLSGAIAGLSTGFRALDTLTLGLRKGELVIIGGRPAMGVTTLALNIAVNNALDGNKPIPVAFFSEKSSVESLAMRVVASLSDVSLGRLGGGYLTDEDWPKIAAATSTLAQAPLYFDDTPALTDAEICSRARALKQQHAGLGLIVVDHLSTAEAELERATLPASMKLLAHELQLPVIIGVRLNRNVEKRPDKTPRMTDLHNLTEFRREADQVLLIYREEVYEEDSARKGSADVLSVRSRHGDVGSIALKFEGHYSRFSNYVPDFLFSG